MAKKATGSKKFKYAKSRELFEKASTVIPLASQTFSKSYVSYYKGDIPFFVERGKGAYVWDVDGNKFLDLICALLPVVLGYDYKPVNKAIDDQMRRGISFSLPHPLEYQLAKKLTELIPCAEMVRFGKNGTDVTSAAVRLARYITKRDKVIVCGYHGWQDWYIGSTTRNGGVPKAVQRLTIQAPFNDITALEKIYKDNKGEIAAMIIEPMHYQPPVKGYLKQVKELTHKNGALLIFDEIVTGFRIDLGGAQKYFNVVPDLATFGKSAGNGMPISMLVGKAKHMQKVEEIFFSGTFGGETLSLAATLKTIEEIEKRHVIKHIWKQGEALKKEVNGLIKKNNLQDTLEVEGYGWLTSLAIKPAAGFAPLEIKSYFQQEMLRHHILTLGAHNMSYAHGDKERKLIVQAYREILPLIADALKNKTILKNLEGQPIQDLFRVRNN